MIWFAYGMFAFSLNILIPHGVSLIVCMLQILLKCVFPGSSDGVASDEGEVNLGSVLPQLKTKLARGLQELDEGHR